MIVEDDYDAEFRYDRDPVGALQGLAPDVVVHCGSLSKTLAPAMRLGWVAAPPAIAAELAARRVETDHHAPTLVQAAFALMLESGDYDRHLRAMRLHYRRRRDALLAAVAAALPEVSVSGAAAGLHFVLELPAGTDSAGGRERRRSPQPAPGPVPSRPARPAGGLRQPARRRDRRRRGRAGSSNSRLIARQAALHCPLHSGRGAAW